MEGFTYVRSDPQRGLIARSIDEVF